MSKTVSTVTCDSQLAPEAWKVLLESSEKPLRITGQLNSWLASRSWVAGDVCLTLSHTPLTSFKICPKRGTPLYESLTGGEKRALFETDCIHKEATFSNFREWLTAEAVGSHGDTTFPSNQDSEGLALELHNAEAASSNTNQKLEMPAEKKARLELDENSLEGGNDVATGIGSNPLLAYPGRDFWVYADYKYMCNVCKDVPELLDAVDWGVFGFKGRGGRDSVLWVGSEGACTPCHYDTYGYNLVAQLSGEKRWSLFSPKDSVNLYPTRIPFEELSVFSDVDVVDPDLLKFPRFRDATPYQASRYRKDFFCM